MPPKKRHTQLKSGTQGYQRDDDRRRHGGEDCGPGEEGLRLGGDNRRLGGKDWGLLAMIERLDTKVEKLPYFSNDELAVILAARRASSSDDAA